MEKIEKALSKKSIMKCYLITLCIHNSIAIGLKNCLLIVDGLKAGKCTFFRRKFYYLFICLTIYWVLTSFHSFSSTIVDGKGQNYHSNSLKIPACLMIVIAIALGCAYKNSNLSTTLMVSASTFLINPTENLELIFKTDSKGER